MTELLRRLGPAEAAQLFPSLAKGGDNGGQLFLSTEDFCAWCAHRHLGHEFVTADEQVRRLESVAQLQ